MHCRFNVRWVYVVVGHVVSNKSVAWCCFIELHHWHNHTPRRDMTSYCASDMMIPTNCESTYIIRTCTAALYWRRLMFFHTCARIRGGGKPTHGGVRTYIDADDVIKTHRLSAARSIFWLSSVDNQRNYSSLLRVCWYSLHVLIKTITVYLDQTNWAEASKTAVCFFALDDVYIRTAAWSKVRYQLPFGATQTSRFLLCYWFCCKWINPVCSNEHK